MKRKREPRIIYDGPTGEVYGVCYTRQDTKRILARRTAARQLMKAQIRQHKP